MATLFMDNFQVYGEPDIMLDGMYADIGSVSLTTVDTLPALQLGPSVNVLQFARKVLNGTYDTLFVAARVRLSTLPTVEPRSPILLLRDISNTDILCWYVDTTGRIVVSRGGSAGVELARSASPCIGANTWHHVEMKVVIDPSAGSVEIRVDDNSTPVINITGVNTSGTGFDIAQVVLGNIGGFSVAGITGWWTDFHVWDDTGTRNNDFLGDVAVATLWPNADVQTGWTPNYRHKIEDGILSTVTDQASALTCADSAGFEMGTGDYTLETFIRFDTLPTGTQRQGIFGKWDEPAEQRSYQLSKCGPSLSSGNLEFRISTTGTAGGIQTLHSVPWSPETDRWYNVAIVRASGQNLLFIDGVLQNVPIADAFSYFDGTAVFAFGGTTRNSFGVPITDAGASIYGWFDETRVSKYARYTVNYTPTTVPYGRDVGSDPQFATVQLLMGYDNGIADESSFGRTITGRSESIAGSFPPVANFPDDGEFQYQTIDAEDTLAFGPPRDDTNISASLYAATAILTLIDNPANNETVTIAGQAYTFKTVVGAAFTVLIGAAMVNSLHNLAMAVNQGPGIGTLYGTGTTANTSVYAIELPSPQMQVAALVAGTAGNAITVSETLDGSWSGATLAGGADIPGPSSFRFTRMPPGVTVVRSIMTVTRAYKTEAGPAKMRTNFVGPAGAVDLGAEISLPVEPAYTTNIFEEDPDTSGPITPATLLQGRIQFNRTV